MSIIYMYFLIVFIFYVIVKLLFVKNSLSVCVRFFSVFCPLGSMRFSKIACFFRQIFSHFKINRRNVNNIKVFDLSYQ